MKTPVACCALAAVFLFLAAYLPTGLPLGAKVVGAAIVGLAGAFYLGFAKAKAIYSIPLTAVYIFLGMRLPGYPEGKIPVKPDPYIAALVGMLAMLTACAVLFGLGRLVQCMATKYMHKR